MVSSDTLTQQSSVRLINRKILILFFLLHSKIVLEYCLNYKISLSSLFNSLNE